MRMSINRQGVLCATALAMQPNTVYWRDVPDNLSKKIHAVRFKLGLTQAEFAKLVGANQATVSRWEKGAVPDAIMLARIAAAAGLDISYFTDTEFDVTRTGPTLYVKGQVAAGIWRAALEWDRENWMPYQGGTHINAPLEARFGLEVVGESMNEVYPPGTILDCVSCIHAGITTFQSGQRVIVVRTRFDGEVEATVKEYQEFNGTAWLVPKSYNPAFQQPIPLYDGSPEIKETAIIAVVKGSYRPE